MTAITEKHLNDKMQQLVERRTQLVSQIGAVDGAIMQCAELLNVLRTPDTTEPLKIEPSGVVYNDGDRITGPFGEATIRVPMLTPEAEQNAEPLPPKLDEPADQQCATCGRRGNPPDCGGKCPPKCAGCVPDSPGT